MTKWSTKLSNEILQISEDIKHFYSIEMESLKELIKNYNSIILLFVFLVIVGVLFSPRILKVKETPFNKSKLISLFAHISLASVFGYLFSLIDVEKINQLLSMLWSIGFFIYTFFFIVFLKELIIFIKSSKKVTKNFARVYYFLGITYVFTMVASNQLIIINDLLFIVLFIFGWLVLQFMSLEKKVEDEDVVDEESDVEIACYNQLLPTRKKDYEKLIDLLYKNNYDEPFALLINGDWGVGKTSLMNVLLEKLDKDGNFKIYIQPMILDTTDKQMEYFFGQLENILSLNGIYTGKDSPFKKYVNILFQTINTVNMKQVIRLDGLLDKLDTDEGVDFRSSKKRLEKDIHKLLKNSKTKQLTGKEEGNKVIYRGNKKKIYIIIDDFDRVEEETFNNTLIFIKELVNFKGINVIFLMDEQKIDQNEKINREYLDKFVNRKFQLSKIDHDEIFSHFKRNLISEHIQNEWTLKIANVIKNNIVSYINQVSKDFEEEAERIQKGIEEIVTNKNKLSNKEKNNNIDDEGLFTDKIKKYKTEKEKFSKKFIEFKFGISNVRKTKKIIREIKETLIEISYWSSKSENFSVNVTKIERLEELIVRISIFKVLFGESLDKFIKENDFFSVMINLKYLRDRDHLIKSFFITYTNSSLTEEKGLQMDIINDFCNALLMNHSFEKLLTNKETSSQIILRILDDFSKKLTIKNVEEIKDYLSVIMFNSYGVKSDLVKARKKRLIDHIVTLYQEGILTLKDLFMLLGEPQRNPLLDNELYLKNLIEILKNSSGFQNTKDKLICLHYLKDITWHIFIKYQNDIIMLISLYNLKDPSYRYENFKADLGDIYSLEEMVKAIKRIFNEENNSTSDLDFFKEWFNNTLKNINTENKENHYVINATKHYQNRLNDFIKMYQAKEELVLKLNNTSVDLISKFSEQLSFDSTQELGHDIEELYDFICLKKAPLNLALLRSFSSLLIWLERFSRNEFIEKDIINKVEKLYKDIPECVYDDDSDEKRIWLWSTVKLGEIKENLRRTKSEQEKKEA